MESAGSASSPAETAGPSAEAAKPKRSRWGSKKDEEPKKRSRWGATPAESSDPLQLAVQLGLPLAALQNMDAEQQLSLIHI